MTSFMICLKIAVYEARLLLRSWGFRIFTLLGLLILGLLTAGIAAPSFAFPYYFRSLSGSIPLFSFKLFNVYQGIIVVFMATEFFKRDRRTDSTQVIFARSFSNLSYVLGKFLGVLGLFVLINLMVGVITVLIHVFLSETPLNLLAYLAYFLTLNLPTLVFLIGLSFILGMTIRSQASVILLGLAVSALSLVVLGNKAYFIPDIFGFHTPLMYSDFIGLGNSAQLFQLRLPYVLLGLGFIFGTVLLAKRLRQSPVTTALSGALSALLIAAAFGMMISHVRLNRNADALRRDLLAASLKHKDSIKITMESCSLDVELSGEVLSASAEILLKNEQESPAESLLLTLNPGLQVSRVTAGGSALDFEREGHLVLLQPSDPLAPGADITIRLDYAGTPLEIYCYPDIEGEILRKPSKLGIFSVPKKYVFVSEKFVHLTPESGWYPRAGIPLSHRFPGGVTSDYSRYTLSVKVSGNIMAVSQGIPEISESGGGKLFTFRPETRLPQMSLTVGPFEQRTLKVQDVEYSLDTLPGHDYFAKYLDAITEDLPKTITQLKDEFEVTLGLDYPYERLALVEVPIHFYCHKRLWSAADETVQPQMVFLPEMGTLCQGADFASMERMMQRRRGQFMRQGGARGGEINSAQIQGSFFNRFVRNNLLGTGIQGGGFRDTALSSVTESDVDAHYNLLPNYFAFTSSLASDRWPILHSALESWLQDRISAPSFRFNRSEGLTDQEKTNRLLDGQSMTELLEDESLDGDQLNDVILAKGKYLMSAIESRIQEEKFDEKLLNFIKENNFSTITEDKFLQFLFSYKEFDLEPVMAAWYSENRVPAFTVGSIGLFTVRDGEQQRHNVLLPVTNVSETEGIVKIGMMSGQSRRGMRGGGAGMEVERTILIPPKTTMEVGILLDNQPMLLQMDTTISRNIPSTMNLMLYGQRSEEAETFFEGERSVPYTEDRAGASGEYIVDNEDPGFAVAGGGDNRLRSAIRRLFDRSDTETEYLGFNRNNPPGRWTPVILQEFYGTILHTGHMIRVGEGGNSVSWTVDLPESGSYDIFFYNETMSFGRGRGGGQRERQQQLQRARRGFLQEEKHFIVHHEDGTEEIDFDILESPQGWVLLGTFRLAAGANTVEQTDMGKGAYLTADAMKWVKSDQN
jgi:ABC-type transport system involved in multi-copper enzyme maturation permease subunit